MLTLQQIDRAKQKAQELWDKYHSPDCEELIKRAIFEEIVIQNDPDAQKKINFFNDVWEEVKALDEKGYWGFDSVGLEFCKALERAYKMKELGILN